ncbi:MAG: hypothetical protein KGP29_05215 [Proteobacteria bacterium]|nr:hypothetical protein [Pseudomonadota bacterium]
MSKKTFNLDDFVGEEFTRKVDTKIDREEKISNFAKIKISAIDPRIRSEIEDKLKSVKQNLNKLKKL